MMLGLFKRIITRKIRKNDRSSAEDEEDFRENSIITSVDNSEDSNEYSIFNFEYDLARNIVCPTSVPLLEQIALTRFALSLWQQEDIRNEIARYDFFKSVDLSVGKWELDRTLDFQLYLEEISEQDEWSPIKAKVIQKISHLTLNTYFKNKILQKIEQIGKEIFLFLYFENQRQYGSNSDGLDLNKKIIYIDHIHWNMEGTINKVKTVSNIIDKTNIKTLDKYILSCNYCLEEKIRFLFKKLPKIFLQKYFKNMNRDINKYLLVYFWTLRIRGKNINFTDHKYRLISVHYSSGVDSLMNHNSKLLLWAIGNNYEVAVPFIWENVNVSDYEEKNTNFYLKRSLSLFEFEKGSLNIVCYFLFVDNWRKYCFDYYTVFSLLKFIILDFKWRPYIFLPAAKYFLCKLKIISYSDLLVVILCYGDFEDNFVKFIYTEIMTLYPCDFSWCDTLTGKYNLAWYITYGKDKDVANFVLSMCTPTEKKTFIYSEDVMYAFKSALSNLVELSWLDCLLQNIFCFDQEIKDFKKHVVLERGLSIFISLEGRRDYFLKILQWFNCDEEELNIFKKELLCKIKNALGSNPGESWILLFFQLSNLLNLP